MSNQKKRIVKIEPLKHMVNVDPKLTWKILEDAIREIYNQNIRKETTTEQLYSGLVTTLTKHIREVSELIEAAQGDLFLEVLKRKWEDHNKALEMIQGILMYMDRTFISSTHRTPVYQLGLNLWRDNIIHSNQIQTRLLKTLLDLVQRERTGEIIAGGGMKNAIMMYVDLGSSVYQDYFEKPFLEVSADFYSVESQQFIESCECGNYLERADRRLDEEMERASKYLATVTKMKIINVVEKEMVANHMQRLVDKGLVNMLVDDKFEDLRRMYSLFGRVSEGLPMIRDVMGCHVRETGKQLVSDPERLKDPMDFVQCLSDKKDKYDKIISLAFNNDKTFQNALNSSFEYFMNLNARTPEFISLFVDCKLRKGLDGISEEDLEIFYDKVLMIFRYVQEKDVFEKYYKQHLAKRLLSGKSVSEDAERSLIVKLKTECGYQFTSKLEGMFTDLKTSKDTTQGFYASQTAAKAGESPTLSVQVLTTGFWPTQPRTSCILPAEILGLCERFQAYYLGAHTGRRLTWQMNMGTADLKVTFGNGKKHVLNVSTYQMCILMLFNDADRLSYKEIEEATKLPTSDLKRCLQSLACVKGKIVLRKEPMSKDIGVGDTFFFNDKFTCKSYKVKIGTVVTQKVSEPEKLEIQQRVEVDRKPQIEAAIVRIMKSRRVLDHNSIVAEVTKQLQSRFLPNPVMIKKRIEALIQREFLERDAVNMNMYKYLA
ncbi:hypothetical protein MKX03_023320 [Papaver bracteatum]|nr:hypothetical protein MKX03_023320 [Papaver bracteatum]